MSEVGIFAIDPGGSTGVAWGYYDLSRDTVAEAMQKREMSGSCTITGDEQHQIEKLSDQWYNFNTDHMGGDIELVIEDFSLVPGSHTPGKVGISPVRIAWGFLGYIWGYNAEIGAPTPIWQLAAKGMRFNTQQMLKRWDAWVVGKEHERAAFAHTGARLMDLY
jgi:hypothetical protein